MTRDVSIGVALAAIAGGAVLGAWARWGLAVWLNPRVESLPLGTLAANVIGGYLVGVAVALFLAFPGLSPVWRLAAITGFLGGLTTFSTFSAEAVAFLQAGRFGPALVHIGLHLAGSILATIAGIATVRVFAPAS